MIKRLSILFLMIWVCPILDKDIFAAELGNEVLLVSDFSGSLGSNLLGGVQGGDGELPGVSFPTNGYIASGTSGPTSDCLKLTYDVKAAGSFTFYWMKLGPKNVAGGTTGADLSKYSYMGFWVRGKEGRERFKIEVHQDVDGDGFYTAGRDLASFVYVDNYTKKGIERNWNKVHIPLKDFKRIVDWSKTIEVVLTFENFANIYKNGVVYLDDIVFGTSKASLNVGEAVPFVPRRESLKIDGASVSDDLQLGEGSKFSLALQGNVESFDSLFIVVSQDGFSWKTIGRAYANGTAQIAGALDTYTLDRSGSFNLDIWAYDKFGQKVGLEKPFKNVRFKALEDNVFLEDIQRRAFQFFWDGWNLSTGLIWDATQNDYSSIAATGFGLAAYCLGAERGWVEKDQAKNRVLKTIDTFLNKAENRSGFFYHFLNLNDASRFGKSEVSVVDTAILIWGLLTAGEYFGDEVKEGARKIYERIVWKDFVVQDPESIHYNQFWMGWLPEGGPEGSYLDAYWDYYSDEIILISLLAVGSPTHPVESDNFYAWKREKGNYGLGRLFVQTWHGGLFAYQYAHGWADLRGIKDREGINWWQNSIDATAANRQFCIDQMERYKTYGPLSWGITSMAYPNVTEDTGFSQITEDYTMNHGTLPCGTGFPLHDGTIGPSGSACSIAFFPEIVKATLRHMIVSNPQVWGPYSFRSSFNLDVDWFSTNFYGIDLGSSILAVENYRNEFFWNLTKKISFVQDAVKKAGFVEDTTAYKLPVMDEKSKTGEISAVRMDDKNLIIEDFDDTERVKASVGVKFGSWDKDPEDTSQKATVEIDATERHNGFGASLKVGYDVDSHNPAFNGVWLRLNGLDVSLYQTLEFWVKGAKEGMPVRFKVELKGEGGTGSTYVDGIATDWKKISVPLTQFRGISRLNQLDEITIVFEDHAVGQKTGTIYIDDIQFGVAT